MTEIQNKQLLRNKEVLEEIGRHQWLESEKAGHDIGFDKAAEDWLIRFSKAWMDYHLPKQKQTFIGKIKEKVSVKKNQVKTKKTASKGR